ncbi:MAG: MFS transporter [Clostridium perfringens]|nr:MFS transporter [Clostridium perfringens]
MESVRKKGLLTPILIALPSLGLGLSWNMKSTVLTLLVKTITPSDFKLGLITAIGPVAGMIFPYLSGVISDRTNFKIGKRKPWVLLGGCLGSIFLFLFGFSPNYIVLFLLTFGIYSSLNFLQGSYYSWMPEAVKPNQIGTVNGLGKLFYSLGGTILFFIGVYLFYINKELPFILILCCIMIPVFIVCFFVKEESAHVKQKSKLSFDFLKNKRAMKVFMTAFFFYIAYGLMTPFWIPYYEKYNNFTSSEISLALTSFTLIGLFLSLFIGLWCDKWNKQYIFLIACIVYIVAFIIGWNVSSISMLWVFAVTFGIGFVIMQVVFYALIPEVAPKEKIGEYMGINNIFLCIPQIISSILGGYLLDISQGHLIFPIAIASLIVACIVIGFGKIEKNKCKI